MKKTVNLVIADFDDTLTRTSNPNTGLVPDRFSWASDFRGDSFFEEIIRQHPKDWQKIFFSLYDDTNVSRRILNELILRQKKDKFKNFIILTAGLQEIQRKKLGRVGLLELAQENIVVAKSYEKTDKIIEIVLDYPEKIKKIIIAEDRPHDIDAGKIEVQTQIPVELVGIKLSSISGPNMRVIKSRNNDN